jgi:uncharacterized protein (TIGR02611 family)
MRRMLLVLSETAREKAKEASRRFKESKPGLRFEHHYHDHQRSSSGRYRLQVILCIFGGFLIVVGGVIAVPGPGPGWLIILLGLWMLAGESLFLARFMDRVEVRLSKLARRVAGIWTISSALVKGLITLTILVCVAALGYGVTAWFV